MHGTSSGSLCRNYYCQCGCLIEMNATRMNHIDGRTLALKCQLVKSSVLSTVAVLAFLVDCVCAVPGWHGRNDRDTLHHSCTVLCLRVVKVAYHVLFGRSHETRCLVPLLISYFFLFLPTSNLIPLYINPPTMSRPHSVNDEPLSNTPGRRVTIRSVRSLHGTLPNSNGIMLGGPEVHKPELSILECLKTILFATKINFLLIFIPLGILSDFLHWPEATTFVLNFIAIIPLAKCNTQLGHQSLGQRATADDRIPTLTQLFVTTSSAWLCNRRARNETGRSMF